MSGNSHLLDEDFIPRYKSTATVAIEGMKPVPLDEVNPGDIADEYIMWTGLGYPPVAEIRAVRCRPSGKGNARRRIHDKRQENVYRHAQTL